MRSAEFGSTRSSVAAEEGPAEVPTLPGDWATRLDEVCRLVLIRALHPSRSLRTLSMLVRMVLGPQFVNPPTTSMAAVYKDTDPVTPCVFILSQGADPTSRLLAFAEAEGMSSRTHVVSLGAGQGHSAEVLL